MCELSIADVKRNKSYKNMFEHESNDGSNRTWMIRYYV